MQPKTIYLKKELQKKRESKQARLPNLILKKIEIFFYHIGF